MAAPASRQLCHAAFQFFAESLAAAKLYARQLAWLHTKRPKAQKTRAETLGKDAKVPALKGAEYLIDMLFECGIHELDWRELAAWSEMTGTPLSSWESQALMAISKTYTFAVNEYSGKDEPAPYQPLDFDRNKVANSVRDALRKKRR